MASLQILKSPISASQSSNSLRKSSCFCSKFNSEIMFNRFRSSRSSKCLIIRKFGIYSKFQEGDPDNQSNGEEPPESLFMKELRRRGMNANYLLEESNRSYNHDDDDISYKKEQGSFFSRRNPVSVDFEESLLNQRARSMSLNSEGLEGLFPRAKLLLTLGGTFFLAFWQLILITVAIFIALFLYFGLTFVHDGQDRVAPPGPPRPQYIDPYALLEEDRISQIAPRLN